MEGEPGRPAAHAHSALRRRMLTAVCAQEGPQGRGECRPLLGKSLEQENKAESVPGLMGPLQSLENFHMTLGLGNPSRAYTGDPYSDLNKSRWFRQGCVEWFVLSARLKL